MSNKAQKPKAEEVRQIFDGLSIVTKPKLNRVFDEVLDELLILFWPPYRADTNRELLDCAVTGLKQYVEDLSDYTADELSAGWREVRRRHKTQGWPALGVVLAACDAARAKAKQSKAPDANAEKAPSKAEIRREKKRLFDDFMAGFQQGPLWSRASDEGFILPMMKYVQTCAEYQAGLLAAASEGAPDIPLNENVRRRYSLDDLERDGRISVSVSDAMIESWNWRGAGR